MAKRIISEAYTFNPATRQVFVLGKWIRREQLLLITNVTQNTVIYNFSDPTLGYTAYDLRQTPVTPAVVYGYISGTTLTVTSTMSGALVLGNAITGPGIASGTIITGVTTAGSVYTVSVSQTVASAAVPVTISAINSGQELTTITLSYNTTSYASTDILSILVEETNESMSPSETLLDPVGKMRVSQPQSLIDTDFEYGTQPTKWESLATLNMRPGAFYDATVPIANVSFVHCGVAGNTGVASNALVNGTRYVIVIPGASSWAGANGPATPVAAGTEFTSNNTTTGATDGVAVPLIQSNALVAGGRYTIRVVGTGNWTTVGASSNAVGVQFTATGTTNGATDGWAISSVVTAVASTPSSWNTLYPAGTPVFFQNSLDQANAEGWWVVDGATSPTTSMVTFKTLTAPTNAYLYDSTKSYLFGGSFYTGASLQHGTAVATGSSGIASGGANGLVIVQTTNPHNLAPGNHVQLTGNTTTTTYGSTTNGTWSVYDTPTKNTFRIQVGHSTQTITLTGVTLTANTVYVRQKGLVTHRAFDGGVQFTNQQSDHGYSLLRQTRRYFRYQSGKGIQFSTGSMLKPALAVDSVTASGTTVGATITVTTKFSHGLAAGSYIAVQGIDQTGYNGTYQVASAPSLTTFTYTATTAPSATTATSSLPNSIVINPASWYGSGTRIGIFDHQNGAFFEFDGQTLWACRRTSTLQLQGGASVTNGSATVTGVGTAFATQLSPGDYVVLRGMSYLVTNIASNTSMTISPEYRGTTSNIYGNTSGTNGQIATVIISKTVDIKIPQSAWNIDRCDGTGHSGFNVDLTKMQMFYIDYSWYGAGAIRYGFKNNRGEVIYCHRFANNNVNTEAYMRSGNLPARYETHTFAPQTYLTSTLGSAVTTGGTISVADASLFPSTGTIVVEDSTSGVSTSSAGNIEYITYTAKNGNVLTVGSRAQAGGATSAQTFTASTTAKNWVRLHSPSQASTISHWGSSMIMDGRYDDDKSLIFNVGTQAPFYVTTSAVRKPILSLRIAPSVDSGVTGLLGNREIINRMQMVLRGVDTYTSTIFRIELVLNGTLTTSSTWGSVGGSSLAQWTTHASADTISGGESIGSFFTPGFAVNSQDLNLVRDMGTSILGGGTSNSISANALNKYPDGPDVLTICATAVYPAANVSSLTATSNSVNSTITTSASQVIPWPGQIFTASNSQYPANTLIMAVNGNTITANTTATAVSAGAATAAGGLIFCRVSWTEAQA